MNLTKALTAGALAAAFAGVPAVAASATPAPPPSSGYSASPAPSPSSSDSAAPTDGSATPSEPGSMNEVGALYSETTVRGPQGDAVVVATQWGKVATVSDDSLAVQSADGTSWTWTVDDKTKVGIGDQKLDSVKVGDQVSVAGTKDGETRTAKIVSDPMTTLEKLVQEGKAE